MEPVAGHSPKVARAAQECEPRGSLGIRGTFTQNRGKCVGPAPYDILQTFSAKACRSKGLGVSWPENERSEAATFAADRRWD